MTLVKTQYFDKLPMPSHLPISTKTLVSGHFNLSLVFTGAKFCHAPVQLPHDQDLRGQAVQGRPVQEELDDVTNIFRPVPGTAPVPSG